MRVLLSIIKLILAVSYLLFLCGCPVEAEGTDPVVSTVAADFSGQEDDSYREKALEYMQGLSPFEKLTLVSGPGNYLPVNNRTPVDGTGGYINGVKNDRMDLPAVALADGPAGIRISPIRQNDSHTYYSTAWPVATLLASSWDTELVRQVGAAMGNEVKEYGAGILLAPGMNIQRNPLGGRNFEYYSEDPLLTGMMAAAMVKGIQSNGVGATMKHLVANNSETNRMSIDTISDPRTLREIYLRSFQIALEESRPWAVMSSYNKVNGIYTNQRRDLLTDILRTEWGFDGLVVSDWYAGNVYNDPMSAVRQMEAGNNLIMPGEVISVLGRALKNNSLSEEVLEENAVRVLTQALKTPSYQNYPYSDSPDLESHAALARRAGAEGMVLLKNSNSALPIARSAKVAFYGSAQFATYKGGTGSGNVSSSYVVNMADGMRSRFNMNTDLMKFYKEYYETNKVAVKDSFVPELLYRIGETPVSGNHELEILLADSADKDDMALIGISRFSGEWQDRTDKPGDYRLTASEEDMILRVSRAFHDKGKRVAVILNVAGVIDTSRWSDEVDAILLAYMGGQETGNQIADIVSGAVNPSGKLAQTFPLRYDDVPSASTFPGVDFDYDGNPDRIVYNEGIYVGYRYYSTYEKDVAYPFGFGLSYTTFSFDSPQITEQTLIGEGGTLTLSVSVKNTGSVPGKEVAQVYVRGSSGRLDKPVAELKAFAKTDLLEPGQTELLRFDISTAKLASFDPEQNRWILEPGEYSVYIAPSSDISDTERVTFTLLEEVVVAETTDSLSLPEGTDVSDVITIPLISEDTHFSTSAMSAVGSNRATTFPFLSTTNLVKFHLISGLFL